MRRFQVFTLQLAVLLAVAAALPVLQDTPKCGYAACPKTKHGMINVHLVPHSHDDVGWLKTVDQYYYGSNTRIQRAGVQYILDTVIQELLHDPKKRFIQVETFFFAKWWKNQDDSIKHQVQKLVRSGQLEFIGGAWSMNDEACTSYQSIVDQFTWGYRFLNDTFGPCSAPRVAWQIDPFGHSRGFATILTQLGIDGVFFGRIDHEDKSHRLNQHTPEMVWRTSPNLGRKADLFTGVLFNNYSPPPGFCFDDLCADDPINDDKKSPDYNVETKVDDFIYAVREQAKYYGTNQVILTMGGDFTYQAAHNYYSNLDKLIRYTNNRQGNGSNINVFYSTPSCYLKALHDANSTWTTKDDDFFPYGSDPHAFWTGYFTSRPTHKFMERHGNNFLQVCKQLFSVASLTPEDRADLTAMREAMGVVQHHDAITGTEKQHVANDYARILAHGFDECGDVAEKALLKLTKKNTIESMMTEAPEQPPEFKSCLHLNTSQCEFTEFNDRFVVTIYNPLAQKENTYVRLPVQKGTYTVRCPEGKQHKVQLVPIPEEVVQTPGRVMSPATFELVFHAEHLPPLGFRSYYVEKTSTELPADDHSTEPVQSSQIGFEQGVLVDIDDKGFMTKVTKNGAPMDIKQNFLWYRGAVGDNSIFEKRASGAYIFRPNGTAQAIAQQVTTKVYKGEIVQEVHQTFSPWVSQVIRVYANEKHVELIWNVGPIPIDDDNGKEIISRYDSPLESKSQFYTDTNGREMLQRTRDSRPTWKVNLQEKISGNYYPINSRLSLRDPAKRQSLAVLVDRSEGGSSLKDGELELMVHRRLLHDDAFGVGEALNETAFGKGLVARGTHVLFAGEEGSALGRRSLAAQERLLSRRLLLRSWLFFSSAKDVSFEQWQKKYVMEFSGVQKPLPHNVHLMTLEPWKGRSLLIRLEHFFERNEDHELSKPAKVNLQEIFKPFKIVSARETTLGGNEWINDNKRMVWKAESNDIENEYSASDDSQSPFDITLNPMEIRTFVVEVAS